MSSQRRLAHLRQKQRMVFRRAAALSWALSQAASAACTTSACIHASTGPGFTAAGCAHHSLHRHWQAGYISNVWLAGDMGLQAMRNCNQGHDHTCHSPCQDVRPCRFNTNTASHQHLCCLRSSVPPLPQNCHKAANQQGCNTSQHATCTPALWKLYRCMHHSAGC